MKINPAYQAANEVGFSVGNLDAPVELLVEFHGFREGENKTKGTAFISSTVTILNVITNQSEKNLLSIGKEFDVLTNFGPTSRITMEQLVKAFKGYGFNTDEWNDNPASDKQYAIMIPASLKYLAVHKIKGVVKVAKGKPVEGKDAMNFPNVSKFVRHDMDGVDYPDNPPEVIEYDHLAEAWDTPLSKDVKNAVKGF
jgi:hypothetical protein